MADRFPFLRVYKDMAAALDPEDRADFYDALIEYALDGKEPAPSTGAAVFQAARRMVDKWRQTSAAGKARAAKSAGRSLDGRWTVAGSEKPAKEEKNKRIKDKRNSLTNKQSKKKYSEHDNNKAASAAEVRPQDVVDLFNATCKSMTQVKTVTDTRRRHIRARLKEHEPSDFLTVFEKAEASDFLAGRVKEWRASFDWIVGFPDHFQRILEGAYDNRQAPTALDAADKVAEAFIGSADPEAVADFERSMNGGYRTT